MKWRQKASKRCTARARFVIEVPEFEADNAMSAEVKANEIANTIEDTLGEGFEIKEVLVMGFVDENDPQEARGE